MQYHVHTLRVRPMRNMTHVSHIWDSPSIWAQTLQAQPKINIVVILNISFSLYSIICV